MKDSFILYNKYQEVFDELSDEEAGKLIKAILEYSNTGICKLDGVLKAVFTSIKQDIDYNNKKYEEKCEKNRENVAKRWGKNSNTEDTNEQKEDTKNTTVYDGIRSDTKNTEYDNEYDNDYITKLDNTFNLIINEDCENLEVEKIALDSFDSIMNRLDLKISANSVQLIPKESLLKYKVIYYSLFSLYFSSYQVYFDTLTRRRVINKFSKTEKYKGRLKSIPKTKIEEFVGYFIKCLQDDFDKKT